MAFLISGFLKIAMESITGNSEYNCSNKNKINSKASGGRTPNGVKIRLIKMNPNNGGIIIYSKKREKECEKSDVCLSISFSLLDVFSCARGHDLVAYSLCFNEQYYVHHHGDYATHYQS